MAAPAAVHEQAAEEDEEKREEDGDKKYKKLTLGNAVAVKNLVDEGVTRPGAVYRLVSPTIRIPYVQICRALRRYERGDTPEQIAGVKKGRGRKFKAGVADKAAVGAEIRKTSQRTPTSTHNTQSALAKQREAQQSQICGIVRDAGLEALKPIRCKKPIQPWLRAASCNAKLA